MSRLPAPRTKSVTSPDGGSSVLFEGFSTNPDLPGDVLRFTIHDPISAEVRTIVCDMTIHGAGKTAIADGVDWFHLPLEEVLARVISHAERHGRAFEVLEFSVVRNDDAAAADVLRDRFLDCLMLMTSSTDNNAAGDVDGAGYYGDVIRFLPHDVGSRDYRTIDLR